jgi:3-dehydroquinate synthase
MIKRIVQMTFAPDKVEEFQQLFHQIKDKIYHFPGCQHLELWRDVQHPQRFFTYSFWAHPHNLENYRNSEFFAEIWPKTKALFAEKAKAWTVEVADTAPSRFSAEPAGPALKQFLQNSHYSQIFVLVDSNTEQHCWPLLRDSLAEFQPQLLRIPPGESHKNWEQCLSLWTQMLDKGDRNSLLINLGGGVLCDLGAFCATTFLRGIDFIHLPTTLLAAIDAAIGGKNGIDHLGFKNTIGTFSEPRLLLLDPVFLETLPPRQIYAGLAEALKHSLLVSEERFLSTREMLKNPEKIDFPWLLEQGQIKRSIVQKDPLEQGDRKALNLGHTLGHALESHWLGSKKEILHGEAVLWGLWAEAKLAEKVLQLSPHIALALEEILQEHYPLPKIEKADLLALGKWVEKDKKNRQGKTLWVLLKAPGQWVTDIEVPNWQALLLPHLP